MPKCPQCGRGPAHRALRRGPLESLLFIIALHPFRCQFCTHRFLAVHFKPGSFTRREYERVRVHYAVALAPAFAENQFAGVRGTIFDLSIRGCLMESEVPLFTGSCVRLEIEPMDGEPPIEVDGAVVRSVNGKRTRLAFFKIRPDEETRIRRLLEIHLYSRQVES